MKRRGTALIVVLMIASIFTMLTGAFLTVHRSNFATLSANERQREARMACQAGVQFAIYQLQQDQTWARQPFSANRDISPPNGLIVSEVRGQRTIRGQVLPTQPYQNAAHFEVSIVNRLDLAASEDGSVPADKVLLAVRGNSGSFALRCDVLLQGEPLYDASLTGHTSILMDHGLENLIVDSADAARNWIRSNGDIRLGNFVGPSANEKVTIVNRPDHPQGVVWAKGDITAAGRRLEGDLLDEAIAGSGGLFSARSRIHHDIYELSRDDLNIPDGEPVRLDPGIYAISLEERRLRPPGGGDEVVHRVKAMTHTSPSGEKTIWYNDSEYLSTAVFFGYDLVPPAGVSQVHMAQNHEIRLGQNPYNAAWGALRFNFDLNEFATVSQFPLKVEGSVAIVTDLPEDDPFYRPNIKLDGDDWKSGVFEASGDVTFQGTVSGSGAVVAGRNLALGTRADLEADSNETTASGVVLHGGNVTILGGNKPEVTFKGLIYAQNDFNVYGGAKFNVELDNGPRIDVVRSDRSLDRVHIEGAAVAQAGRIWMSTTKKVDLRYNEAYLKALTKGFRDNRRRVSQVWSRFY